ncbi:MAG: DUF6883 domain-containing protein, partial [Chloroherpetonaceae bacterium]
MKLESIERAYLPQEKVLYLLTPREKNDKSNYFKSFGFTLDEWERLHRAIIEHAKQGSIVMRKLEFDFEKIEVVGVLPT